MFQNILVLGIVGIALFFVVRRLVRFFRPGQAPSCKMGCDGCKSISSCAQPQKEIKP